jgi:hypothetical protein
MFYSINGTIADTLNERFKALTERLAALERKAGQ